MKQKALIIDVSNQTLELLIANKCYKKYLISTATLGTGQHKNSFQTPLGQHLIRAKIGANAPLNMRFKGRRPTGYIYQSGDLERYPGQDWILTRILWLSGCEVGVNRLGDVDTMQRYIYIHGAPDEVIMGQPGSRGCIRMHNQDIIELFNLVQCQDSVIIQ